MGLGEGVCLGQAASWLRASAHSNPGWLQAQEQAVALVWAGVLEVRPA